MAYGCNAESIKVFGNEMRMSSVRTSFSRNVASRRYGPRSRSQLATSGPCLRSVTLKVRCIARLERRSRNRGSVIGRPIGRFGSFPPLWIRRKGPPGTPPGTKRAYQRAQAGNAWLWCETLHRYRPVLGALSVRQHKAASALADGRSPMLRFAFLQLLLPRFW